MRAESYERSSRISVPAVEMNGDPSARALNSSPLDLAPTGSTSSSHPCGNSSLSPWRGRGTVELLSSWDESHSVSSSIRSTRRRRGGDPGCTAVGEGKDWAQALVDLERMQRENHELLQESLRGDRSDIASTTEDACAGSRLGSSARSSVRRRRRGVVAAATAGESTDAGSSQCGVVNSTPFLETPVGGLVGEEASAVAVPSSGKERSNLSHGDNTGLMGVQLPSSLPLATDPTSRVDKQSLSQSTGPQHSSSPSQRFQRFMSSGRSETFGKALSNSGMAAETVAPEMRGACKVSWSATTLSHAHSSTGEVLGIKPSEANPSSSQHTHLSEVGSQSGRSLVSPQNTHRDPARADALSVSRMSGTGNNAATPSKAVPTSKASLPFRGASQQLIQTHTHRIISGTAATVKGIAPTSADSAGNVHASSIYGRFSPPPESCASLVRTATRGTKLVAEVVSEVPESRPQLQLAEGDASHLYRVGSSHARGSSVTAATAHNDISHRTLEVRNPSVPRSQRLVQDRPTSVLRTAFGVRHDPHNAKDGVTDAAQRANESRSGPRGAASVPHERIHASVTRYSREGYISGSSQTKGDATRSGGGGPVYRATVLTELRRQEVMRERFAREQKMVDDCRARLSAVKQSSSSRATISNSRLLENTMPVHDAGGFLDTRPSSLQVGAQHVSHSRRRASTEAPLIASPKKVTTVRPSLAELPIQDSSMAFRRQNTSRMGVQQGSDSVGGTSSNTHLMFATRTSTSTRTPVALEDGGLQKGIPREDLPHSGSVVLPYEQTLSEYYSPSRSSAPHLSSAVRKVSAAGAISSSKTHKKKGASQQTESKTSTSPNIPPKQASKERVGLSSLMLREASSLPVNTSSGEAAATTKKPAQVTRPHQAADIAVSDAGKLRPTPFCVECGQRHIDDLAKYCALCGHKRAFLPF